MNEKTKTEIRIEAEIDAVKLRLKRVDEMRQELLGEINAKKKDLRAEWNRKSVKEIDNLQDVLAARYSISKTSEKFKKAFDIAWDRGHSCGLTEVAMCFDEMAELLK